MYDCIVWEFENEVNGVVWILTTTMHGLYVTRSGYEVCRVCIN